LTKIIVSSFGQTIYTQIERSILLLFKSATIFKIDVKFTKLQAVKYPYIEKLGFLAVNADFGGIPKIPSMQYCYTR